MKKKKFTRQVEALLAKLTPDEKIHLCHAVTKFSSGGVKRLGIPQTRGMPPEDLMILPLICRQVLHSQPPGALIVQKNSEPYSEPRPANGEKTLSLVRE